MNKKKNRKNRVGQFLSADGALPSGQDSTAGHGIGFVEAFWTWVKIGWLSFGGPAGQIAMMHRILVDEKKWISESRFLHALNYCMLLPGPEAQQLAIYLGWLLHRIRGGVVAGVLFVLPGAAIILLISILYVEYRDLHIIEAVFFGVKAAILAVVFEAVVRIGRKMLKNNFLVAIAVAAFVSIFFFGVPFPLVVVGAGLAGFLGDRIAPAKFQIIQPEKSADDNATPMQDYALDRALQQGKLEHVAPSRTRAWKVLACCLALWFGPVIALAITLGLGHVYVQEGVFFSKMAVVTFGGAYAVLAYMAQQAVNTYSWLNPGEMLDGLGMAETTPGPLIMVVQFVGFVGAYRNPGPLDPMVAGMLGALLTSWVTFVPCFLWIFLGAPYIESLRGNRALSTALSGITAAIVGVILNLSVWFSMHVLFSELREIHSLGMNIQIPVWDTLHPWSALLAIGALILMRCKVGIIKTLAASIVLGGLIFYF
ncbi:chromate efflux transporter [Candidatus Spongiihabitans sp.]|uniref:chromate efflux transporter n=1 Tax=Candidatus Spongiihabitans sp. TaxID=3101308 RepID=UPI003C6F66D6